MTFVHRGSRGAPALAVLLAVLPLFTSCDSSDPVSPASNRTPPNMVGVTAPEVATPDTDVLVRMHWGDTHCPDARFTRFQRSRGADGTIVLEAQWEWPEPAEPCVQLGVVTAVRSNEESTRLRMPDVGPLTFEVRSGGRTVRRTISPGATSAPAWTIEVADPVTGEPPVGLEVAFVRFPPDLEGSAEFLYAGVTDASGRHHFDIAPSDDPPRYILQSRWAGISGGLGLPFFEAVPSTQVAELTTLLVPGRR